MKPQTLLKWMIMLFFASAFLSCGKGDSGAADTLIPDLSQSWKNTNDTEHDDEYFFPGVDKPGTGTSTFTGNENSDGDLHSFSGSYTNSKIQFTFSDGPKSGTKYTGKINGNGATATMTITTPTGTITLQKH